MTQSAVGEKVERKAKRSEFGKCLLGVMQTRDIYTARDLADLMASKGSDTTDRLIRQHWRERVTPRPQFMHDLDKALNLTPVEKARLCSAIYFDDVWREI